MKVIKYIDQRSENEFENMMKIKHENLVKYFDHFYHTIDYIEHICIITEYCENGDLEKRICKLKAEGKKFLEEEIYDWILQATNGLKYLHSDTVLMVHRDIKPANMLLSKENIVKLADLGISKVLRDTLGRTFVGTLAYMSPEIERCRDKSNKEEVITYSFNTDVWSLACVLYELIYLYKAFPEGFRAVKIIPNLTGCDNFTNILQNMLVTDPNNRISSKELYDLMKSTFDIKENSSKAIITEDKQRREQEAKEQEQREIEDREERETFARLKIAEENNKRVTLEEDNPKKSSYSSINSIQSINQERTKQFQDPYIGLFLNERYQVKKKLDRGAFGLVYLVDDIKIDLKKFKEKAMKIMATENELKLFSEINHENIVRYFDHFHMRIEGENQTFLITEYCENGDLGIKIEEARLRNRNFEERQILDWICQATNALKYLHSKKIIHQDIKPANMLLTERNEIKLGDLGLSKLMYDIFYVFPQAATPFYLSPEVFQFMDIKYYLNTDIWSLGCVLYELIFLTKAFPEGQKGNPPIPSNVFNSGIFSSLLPKMFEKDCLMRITSRQLFIELQDLYEDY